MPRKPKLPKHIVAFKVEPDLAALLDAMPNKSEFIRNAVARQLSTACPLCRGTGMAPFTGVSDELTRLVQQHPLCVCAGCRGEGPAPLPHPRPLRGRPADRRLRAVGRLLLRGLRGGRRLLHDVPQAPRAHGDEAQGGVRGLRRVGRLPLVILLPPPAPSPPRSPSGETPDPRSGTGR